MESGVWVLQSVAYPSPLHQLGEHDDSVCVLLPHHPPEVVKGGRQWALCGYVRSAHAVALQKYSQYWTRDKYRYSLEGAMKL